MKKLGIIGIALGISFLVIVFLFIGLRLSGMLQYYNISSISNLPNLKVEEHIFATKFKKPERLDFICYSGTTPFTNKKEGYVHRLCASGGDKVEIRDGILFVNGRNIDSNIQLHLPFEVSKKYLPTLDKLGKDVYSDTVDISADSMVVFYTTKQIIQKNKIVAKPFIFPKEYTDEFILKKWGKKWNADQFGPVIVPENCFFVLGDNRHNALDSRYNGFISQKDFKGTVLK